MEVHVIDVPIERHVVERFAQAMGVPPDELDLAEPLEGEDWEEELIEEICRHLGLAPEVIFPSVERSQRSEIALAGLRRLAPFCGRAARRLQEMQVRWEVTTIRSFIQSLGERRPVGSGPWLTNGDQPIALGSSLLRFAAWTAALAAAITILAWGGCEPACRVCASLTEAALSRGLSLSVALVGGWHLLLLLAALRELGRGESLAAAALSEG